MIDQPWIQIEQQWQWKTDLLRSCLEAAVPIAIADLAWRGGPGPSEIAQAEADTWIFASGGDNLIYASGKSGDTAKLFTRLARTLAIMSFSPGGVLFLGTRWEIPNAHYGGKYQEIAACNRLEEHN